MSLYNLKSLIKNPTCFKNHDKLTCIELFSQTNHGPSNHLVQ